MWQHSRALPLLALLLLALLTPAPCAPAMTQPLTYGSLIKLQQSHSNKWLHSHQVKFGRGGIYSVTGYLHDDLGNYWQVLEQYPINTKTYAQPIRCGDNVRIKSAIIGYNLRIDETSFGLTTELLPMVHGITDDRADVAINWKVKCVGKEKGQPVHFGDEIRLKHAVTGKYIALDEASQYTEFNCRGCEIIGQVQVHGLDGDSEDSTMFRVQGGLTFAREGQVVEQ